MKRRYHGWPPKCRRAPKNATKACASTKVESNSNAKGKRATLWARAARDYLTLDTQLATDGAVVMRAGPAPAAARRAAAPAAAPTLRSAAARAAAPVGNPPPEAAPPGWARHAAGPPAAASPPAASARGSGPCGRARRGCRRPGACASAGPRASGRAPAPGGRAGGVRRGLETEALL